MSLLETVDYFNERFSRHFPLKSIGKEGQLKLKYRKVLIAGMGGLGTASSELLASIGVGFLRIVDYDVVEISNLPRQKLYTDADLGKAKVDVAAQKLKERYPEIEIDPQPTRIDALSAESLLDGIDLVIDGLDSFTSRRALYRVAWAMKIPYLFAGAIAEQGNLMSFTQEGSKPCLFCIIGNVNDDPDQSCEVRGVHPSILELVASIQVAEAVKILLGHDSSLSGIMLYIDLLSMEFDKIQFQKKEDCQLCSTTTTDKLDQGKPGEITKGMRKVGNHGMALITSICGRDTRIVDPKWEIKWDFDAVKTILAKKWNVSVKGDNYVTFTIGNVGVSLLSSGVMTLRGSGTTENAIDIVNQVFEYIKLNKSHSGP